MTHTAIMDQWAIDDDHEIIVALISHEGRWRVDARIWFRSGNDDKTLRPGKGLALGIKHLTRLAAAIEKTRRGAISRFLITPPSSDAFATSGQPLADLVADALARDDWP
jgi:hypothetical protein